MRQVDSKMAVGPLEGQVCNVHAHPPGDEFCSPPLPVASDAHHPGDRWLPGETAWRPQRQVHPPAHAGSSGDMPWGHVWGTSGPYCKPFLSLPCSFALIFHKNPSSDSLLAIPSLLSTSWTPDWQGCWECTHRREPPSCRPCGFTSNTTSCRMDTSASTSTATVTSARLAGLLSSLRSSQPLPCLLLQSPPGLALGHILHTDSGMIHLLLCPERHFCYFPDLQLWPTPFLRDSHEAGWVAAASRPHCHQPCY